MARERNLDLIGVSGAGWVGVMGLDLLEVGVPNSAWDSSPDEIRKFAPGIFNVRLAPSGPWLLAVKSAKDATFHVKTHDAGGRPVVRELHRVPVLSAAGKIIQDPLPVTTVVRSRRGTVAVLQVLGPAESLGVKIRYKVLGRALPDGKPGSSVRKPAGRISSRSK